MATALVLAITATACSSEQPEGAVGPASTVASPSPTDPGPTSNDPSVNTFPDGTTTGVKEGIDLAPSASVTSSHDGEIISALDVTGTVTVEHDDVTIRNVRIRGTGRYGISVPAELSSDVTGLVIEDTEITGIDGDRSAGIAPFGSWTARRVNISGYRDGVKVGTNQTLEDSWIHDLYTPPESHTDGVQSTGGKNVNIVGNRIEGPWQSQTSAIIIQTDNQQIENYTIEANLLSGGTYTLYLRDKDNGHGPPHNITVRNNIWVTNSWAYGPLSADDGAAWTWRDNRTDTGTSIG